MAAGWDRPQEDEFALANLGVPSPYLAWAFPHHGPVNDEYLDERVVASAKPRLLRFDLGVSLFPGLAEGSLKAVRAVEPFK
jgi:hypothetical protein